MGNIRWSLEEEKTLGILYRTVPKKELYYTLSSRTPQSIELHAQSLGLVPKRVLYNFNKQYFSTLNEENSYWAGFIAADGCILNTENAILIGLSDKDKKHLMKFKICINADNPIKTRNCTSNGKRYLSAYLSLYSAKQMINDLNKHFNITPHKSLTLQPPNIVEENLIRHFIRGYMDGDGCIYFSKTANDWIVDFVGTKESLEWIKENIKKYVPNIGNPNVRPHTSICQLRFGGYQTKNILNWLYNDSTISTRLTRKYHLYKKVKKFYNHPKIGTSKYTGVSWYKPCKKWRSYIWDGKKSHACGYFKTEKEAAVAYNFKAKELGLLHKIQTIN